MEEIRPSAAWNPRLDQSKDQSVQENIIRTTTTTKEEEAEYRKGFGFGFSIIEIVLRVVVNLLMLTASIIILMLCGPFIFLYLYFFFMEEEEEEEPAKKSSEEEEGDIINYTHIINNSSIWEPVKDAIVHKLTIILGIGLIIMVPSLVGNVLTWFWCNVLHLPPFPVIDFYVILLCICLAKHAAQKYYRIRFGRPVSTKSVPS